MMDDEMIEAGTFARSGDGEAQTALPLVGVERGNVEEQIKEILRRGCNEDAVESWTKDILALLPKHTGQPQEGERKSHAELLAEARAATERLVAWCDYNEACYTGWGDQIVPSGATELTARARTALTWLIASPAAPPPPVAERDNALVEFARWAINEGAFEGNYLDGADIEDKAEKLGLIIKTKYNPTIHRENTEAEPGDDWYTFAPPLLAEQGEKS